MLHRLLPLLLTGLLLGLLSACGGTQPSANAPATTLPPTWTPTPVQVAAAVVSTPTPAPVAVAPTPVPPPTDTPVPPAAPTATPLPPTATPVPQPVVLVTSPKANLRSGPGVAYDRTGTVRAGDKFDILAKNPAGDWWQIQVDGQSVWIYGDLVQVSQGDIVQVATNIPPAPVRPTATPVPPTATPVPTAPDPCANIGGDGCKFKMRGGPAFAANGGSELKLTLAFVHGGRNNEAQGSYFVWLEKDGVKLPVSDKVRSWTGTKRQGPNGDYNYEYKIGVNELPGNSVAGNYTIWVLDGNGERDSQTFTFTIPDGQGEVWIKFDQN